LNENELRATSVKKLILITKKRFSHETGPSLCVYRVINNNFISDCGEK